MESDPVFPLKGQVVGLVNYSFTMLVTLAREVPEHILPQPPTNIPSASAVALDIMSIRAANMTQGPSGTLG